MKTDYRNKHYVENGEVAMEKLEGTVRLICDECEQHPSNPKKVACHLVMDVYRRKN